MKYKSSRSKQKLSGSKKTLSIFTAIFFIFFSSNLALAQCPTTPIHVTTQEEVDAFIIDYPNCTELPSSLKIGGNGLDTYLITNLNGFSNLTSIGVNLEVLDTRTLTDLNGLNNLAHVGNSLEIKFCEELKSLNGLNNLARVDGLLIIGQNDSLLNLEGLNSLISVGGLSVVQNPELINLNGLENLTSIDGSLAIANNYTDDKLQNIDALSNLTSIGGNLDFQGNNLLTNLDGLNNLTIIGGHLNIIENPMLNNLDGMINVYEIGGDQILIWKNQTLTDINGLSNAISTTFFLATSIRIHDNPLLSVCSTPIVCTSLLRFSFPHEIDNNAEGCNSQEEVLENCDGISKVYFPMFYDVNENGLLDNNESFLNFTSVFIEPNNIIAYGNDRNGGVTFLDYGDYTFSYNQSATPIWELTTSSPTYSVTIDSLNPIETIHFGLKPNQYNTEIQSNISHGLPRCNEYVTFDVIAYNQGTTIADGVLWFDIDANISAVTFIDPPDYEETLRYGWDFENLTPGNNIKKQIILQLPGPPELEIGEMISFNSEVVFNDENGENQVISQSPYLIEVQCAYDPNDKLAQPIYPYNYALIDDEIIYRIRFQNTGNAVAYDVVIEDELDAELDLSTFQVIASSHQRVLNTFMDNNKVTFEFKNIFLPDSTANFDESQGYVLYSIKTKESITEHYTIENTAEIYFDFNPAIVTNTTQNIMVSSFDSDNDGSLIWEDCNDKDPNIYPNAIEIPDNNIDENCDGVGGPTKNFTLSSLGLAAKPNPVVDYLFITKSNDLFFNYQLLDFSGRLILNGNLSLRSNRINLNGLNAGIYFIKVINPENNSFAVEKIFKM